MAVVSATERRSLPDSAFALPEVRKYLIHDREHAVPAKARAAQQLKLKNLTKRDYGRVLTAADRTLRHGWPWPEVRVPPVRNERA